MGCGPSLETYSIPLPTSSGSPSRPNALRNVCRLNISGARAPMVVLIRPRATAVTRISLFAQAAAEAFGPVDDGGFGRAVLDKFASVHDGHRRRRRRD